MDYSKMSEEELDRAILEEEEKKLQSMSEDELDKAIMLEELKTKTRADFAAEQDRYMRGLQQSGRSALEALTALDYVPNVARAGVIGAIDPEKTAYEEMKKAALRNPFKFDEEHSNKALAEQLGVSPKPLGKFVNLGEGDVAQFAEAIPVSGYAGFAADIATPAIGGKIAKAVEGFGTIGDAASFAAKSATQPIGYNLANVNPEELKQSVISRGEKAIVRAAGTVNNDIADSYFSAKLKGLPSVLYDEGLLGLVNNPEKLMEKLRGIKIPTVESKGAAGVVHSAKELVPGRIGQLTEELNGIVKKASKETMNIHEIKAIIKNNLRGLKEEGIDASDSVIDDAIDLVFGKKQYRTQLDVERQYAPNTEYIPTGAATPRTLNHPELDLRLKLAQKENTITPIEVLEAKRIAGKRAFDEGLRKGTSDISETKSKVFERISLELKKILHGQLSDVGDDVLDRINVLDNKITNLIDVESLIKVPAVKKALLDPTFIEKLIGGGAVGAGAAALNEVAGTSVINPLIAGGAYSLARGTDQDLSKAINYGKMMFESKPGLYKAVTGIPAAANVVGKAATSLQRNIPYRLAEFKIPRDSQEIIDNKDIVLAKVAQETWTPEGIVQLKMLEDAINNHQEKIKDVLPALIQMFPQLFEDDKFNRVDGKVMDPVSAGKAKYEIIKEKPSASKYTRLMELNNEGRYDG